MTDPRKQAFLPYIALLAGRMRLADWTIRLADEPSSEDSSADIQVVGPYRKATLRLSEHFLDESPESQRQILAHELVHLVTARLVNFAGDELDGPAFRDFARCYEHGVEELSQIIAPSLPLPPEPDEEIIFIDEDDECSESACPPSASHCARSSRAASPPSPRCSRRPARRWWPWASTARRATTAAGSPRPSASTR